MVSNPRAIASKAQGINWSELLLAYKTFKDNTATGIYIFLRQTGIVIGIDGL
jgi:hypothetical protein